MAALVATTRRLFGDIIVCLLSRKVVWRDLEGRHLEHWGTRGTEKGGRRPWRGPSDQLAVGEGTRRLARRRWRDDGGEKAGLSMWVNADGNRRRAHAHDA